METIYGINNWKLTVRREAGGVTILRAETCDARAGLPESLFGLPVTSLGSRAFGRGGGSGEEQVLVVGSPSKREWDNRTLLELTLPESITTVGDYALAGCGALTTLHLPDKSIRWGSGVFMNCSALNTFVLTGSGAPRSDTVAYLVGEFARELDITFSGPPGGAMTRLIFPEYTEEFEENGPAHIFNFRVHGAGAPYRHVFRDRKLDLRAYDALWPGFLSSGHDSDTALRLAWWRVRYPTELGGAAQMAYLDYLCRHAKGVMRFILCQRDIAGLRLFLEAGKPGEAALHAALEYSREAGMPEATALLLDALRPFRPTGYRKRYTL